MPTPFLRTTRSLATDTSRTTLAMWALTAALFAAWMAWLAFARVTVYEVSAAARIEVEHAARPVTAPLEGTVVSTSVRLGTHVTAGDVLMELDARTEVLRLEEEQTRLEALPAQLAALERQLVAVERAAERAHAASGEAVVAARARREEALAAMNFADSNAQRLAQLGAGGRVAEIEALRVQTDAARARASVAALAAEIERLEAGASGDAATKRAELEALRREVAQLRGTRELVAATIARLQQAIEKQRIRAPVSGAIGEAPTLDIGSFVEAGRIVASIVPAGRLKVIADFTPAGVLGRVRPGQRARMRLDGFPWAQFGTLDLEVERVATEVRNGRVRVELLPTRSVGSRLLQHGLPGAVEVEIEQATPLSLVLRAAGQTLTRSADDMRQADASTP